MIVIDKTGLSFWSRWDVFMKNPEYHQGNSENQHGKQECEKYLCLNKDKERIEISERK